MKKIFIIFIFSLLPLLFTLPARAQLDTTGISIDQRLGQQIPLDITLRDESGTLRPLSDFINNKPTILVPVYFACPMLCTQQLNSLLVNLKIMDYSAGDQFNVITFSFDPRETPDLARAKKANYLADYRRPTAQDGWHFLTADQPQIDRLTAAIGFHYHFDPQSNTYAHATALMILTPEGKISQYFFGIDASARDLKFALLQASNHHVGTLSDEILLFCFHYDPSQGHYSVAILRILTTAAVFTVLLIATFILLSLRHELRKKRLKTT